MSAEMATNSWDDRERRLQDLRREAGTVAELPVTKPSSLKPPSPEGYYGTPLLKRPQWTVEVPIYFFVGGLAGAAALIAAVGELSAADSRLVRQSRWLAAIGGLVSPALLISDLGMPSRFLNMLRVFKVQSPMSLGSWTLVAFSNSAVAAAVLGELDRRRSNSAIRILTETSQIVAALMGMVLSTYTGVLVGATAIPAWNQHVAALPIHFAASGTASAASILELCGNESEALNRIALGAAIVETAMGASIEMNSAPGTHSLRSGVSGWAMRGAGLLSGPVPVALRLLSGGSNKKRRLGLRRAAAISSIVGSLLTRWAWLHAGKQSADRPCSS